MSKNLKLKSTFKGPEQSRSPIDMAGIPSGDFLKDVERIDVEFTSVDDNKPNGSLVKLRAGNAEILTSCRVPELIEHLYKIQGAETAGNIPVEVTSRSSGLQHFDGNLHGLKRIYESPVVPRQTATSVQP